MSAVLKTLRTAILAVTACCGIAGCTPAVQPPYSEIAVLTGSPYERGLQHGQRFKSKIRSLYTMLLESSLLPYLNREHDDIKSFLKEYQDPLYDNGQFSYQVMLQSGENLADILSETHPEYLEEMRAIAEGADMPFEQILLLNTFVDTMLAFRSVTFFLRQIQAPQLLQVEFRGDFTDGIDNNGDGVTDEEDDGCVKDFRGGTWLSQYGPKTHAAMVEVPQDASIRMIFYDRPSLSGYFGSPEDENDPADDQGMDPDSIRIQLDKQVYSAATDDCIQTSLHGEDDKGLEVIFTPPEGLPPASAVSLIVQAGNISQLTDPPPAHARFMRDERIVFTTRGYGKRPHEVDNRGEWDGRSQSPAHGFAVRGSATPDGRIRLAHHFSLLDSNTTHKHCVLFIHRPEGEKAHAVLGWAGIVWGFSGINADGLTYMVTPSDTLDNPLAGQVKEHVFDAKLLVTGVPIGIKGRRILARAGTVEEARALLDGEENTFGWKLLLGDRDRNLAVIELDTNVLEEENLGYVTFGADARDPENLDAYGRPFGSMGPDDLRIAAHFQKNVPDIETTILVFEVQPQRYWSSFYYRSLRAYYILGNQIARRYGNIDVPQMIDILRTQDLVDTRDSMNAVVFEPESLKLHYAMGLTPATDGEFIEFDLNAAFGQGDAR